MSAFKILIVEDHPSTADMVRFHLERENFTVCKAIDGPSGETVFQTEAPHLVIMDLMLPGFDGLELCRRIRQLSNVPILMLTARADDTDKAIGLGVGADDYLTKPFSPTELVARVKAILRRTYQYNEAPKSNILGKGRMKLDPVRRVVTLDGAPLDLTVKEFELLSILMAHPGWAFTRAHLMEKVWGYEDEAGEASVTVHVSNLRNKLGSEGSSFIRTVRGVGYSYEEGV